jgi:cytochrome b6-f complex iron-sulfur subunit
MVGTARFCGRCGAHLPGRDDPGTTEGPPDPAPSALPDPEVVRPAHRASAGERRPTGWFDRRTLLAGLGGLIAGGVIGGAATRRRSAAPVDGDGLPLAEVEVGNARDIADQLADGGVLLVPDDVGRLAVVRWDPSYVSDLGSAMERYGPDGEGHPVLDDQAGLMVLLPVSTHMGCSVRYCDTSAWFEDPCHGARWNSWGEWTFGPAPRGLDRYRSGIGADGVLIVDLTRQVVGPSRESAVLDQPPQGPHCMEG